MGTFDLSFGTVNNVAESKAALISLNRITRLAKAARDMKMINPQIGKVCLRK